MSTVSPAKALPLLLPAEVNAYRIWLKPLGPGLETLEIPREDWAWPGSPRDPRQGDPLVAFRYDPAWEFLDAIRQQRPCVPSFWDGVKAQEVMDAALRSAESRQWVEW